MLWGHLGEFWNSVSSTTLNAWEYTQEWFYNVGNAVAGAIGNLFDFILHYFNDLLCALDYIATTLGFILGQIISPIRYIFSFSYSFFQNAFSDPVMPENLSGFSTTTAGFFNSLPYWNDLTLGLDVLIFLVCGIGIIYLFFKT